MRHDVEKQKPAGAVAYWRSVRRITYVAGSLALGGFAVDKAPDLLEYMSGMSVLFYAGPLAEVTITGNIQGPASGLYTNEPAGSTALTERTFQNSATSAPGWSEVGFGFRTDEVTRPASTCPGVADDYTLRHDHVIGQHYGGVFNYTPGIMMDTMYVAICLDVNSTILGGGANHGIKLDFMRTEDGGGADVFPTWNSANYFGMHWQNGFSEPDDNNAYLLPADHQESPHWFEYIYIASDPGVANGEAHTWIDGVKVYTNTTIDWSDATPGNCTGSRCGFRGWQIYRNTDEGDESEQHYLYTSHFYMSYKGIAN